MPPLLSWTPSNTDIETIDKSAEYIVSLSDMPLQVTCFTPFVDNGQRVKINGHRLYYLIKNKDSHAVATKSSSSSSFQQQTSKYKNHKNVCFQSVSSKSDVVEKLRTKLNLPDCMQRFLEDFQVRPRGKRFRKRFIFNAYIANVLTCTKCNKLCLVKAMSHIYNFDDKCIQEFDRLLFRNDTTYKPPNCDNIKNKDKLCFKNGMCKGSNPICNF
ncbi:late expression factor 2 [Alphabaculovirus altersperidaniae]|uniref:Late expression factor 2 n=1 Tax=Spodoptera eridania nucleopolyhedrovirus TaxID=2315721 RepID=A0ABX6TQT8_9ABAC|nr:late expression factor 2 [Spodoptera eridania nucleopolyhedrovirus]QNV47775.1 late expression factor 2 [Spodoptera eridania nucleopolyhedrovirus]